MERTYLEWNLPNFISVLLMAAVGFTLIGFVGSALRGFGGDKQKAPLGNE